MTKIYNTLPYFDFEQFVGYEIEKTESKYYRVITIYRIVNFSYINEIHKQLIKTYHIDKDNGKVESYIYR